MKLNSIQKNPLYSNPRVNRTRKLIPKDVEKAQRSGFSNQIASAKRENPPKIAFSAVAEKVLSAGEKNEIQKQFPSTESSPVAYSRRGKMAAKTVALGRKIDLKG